MAKPFMQKNPIPPMPWQASHFWQFRPITLVIISIAVSLMGVGEGFLVQASLGSTPWTVLAQGLALQTGLGIGIVVGLISLFVLLLWIPFRLKLGLGTLINVFLIALFVDLTIRFIPAPTEFLPRLGLMLMGLLIFGVSTALYLSCRLGAGPRDGLMVGLCYRYGWRVGSVRTGLEVSVALIGWLLGGTLGVSTVIFAICVGWIIQLTISGLIWLTKTR